MPTIEGSFVVAAPPDLAFAAVHDVEDWPSANPLVKSVRVLEREGNKIVFHIAHADGRAWDTVMFALPEVRVSYSERAQPKPPLKCMQYVRVCSEVEGGTKVTEEVHFELLDPNADASVAAEKIREHMQEVQGHIRNHIEGRVRTRMGS